MTAASPASTAGAPHVVDESVLSEFSLQPIPGLTLTLPVCAVIKTGLRFDFRHRLGVVLAHPTIDRLEP